MEDNIKETTVTDTDAATKEEEVKTAETNAETPVENTETPAESAAEKPAPKAKTSKSKKSKKNTTAKPAEKAEKPAEVIGDKKPEEVAETDAEVPEVQPEVKEEVKEEPSEEAKAAEPSEPADAAATEEAEVPEETPAEAEAETPAETSEEASEKPEEEEEEGKGKKKGKKSKNKKRKKMGKAKKIVLIVLACLLTVIIAVVSVFFGIGSCSKSEIIPPPTVSTTTRKQAPDDGTKPDEHTSLDNIAYMAYVLDHQTKYHAYAKNSTMSFGYEQITQTWKDYNIVNVNGADRKVMVTSDLSYSSLVKSASQTCFVDGTDAYFRTGNGVGQNSVPTDISWSTEQPRKYSHDEYLTVYGEFSTELSVYVINNETVSSVGETINNGDGTYSETLELLPTAACWYQYGMKTHGGLKGAPTFQKITITFKFDEKWQVLETYCEEKATIAPSALGGFPMDSNAKTTTTFSYEESEFDSAHYGYFDSYYKEYLDKVLVPVPDNPNGEINLTDVLMGGFSKVINGEGQQFALSLNIGGIPYKGQIYLKLGDLSDVMNSLDVRVALAKGDAAQDLYIEFQKGTLNVYYSTDFALTANIDDVAASVNSFSQWIDSLKKKEELPPQTNTLAAEGFDLSSLLEMLKVEYDETSVSVSLDTDDLLGLGIGVDLAIDFDRSTVDGFDSYSFKDLKLNELSFKEENLLLSGDIDPDNGDPITHNADPEKGAPASLSEYIDGALNLAKSKSYVLSFSLDGSCDSISYIKGLVLSGKATVQPAENFSGLKVELPLHIAFNDFSADITAYYNIDFADGTYGDIYLSLTSLCGNEVSAKVGCDVKDLVGTVKELIELFEGSDNTTETAPEQTPSTKSNSLTAAQIVNEVLKLNFGSIIKELKGNSTELKVTVNADAVLKAVLDILGKQFDISLGNASVYANLNDATIDGENAKILSLKGELPKLGLVLNIAGSDSEVVSANPEEYADVITYVDGVLNLLKSETIKVSLDLNAQNSGVPYLDGATVKGDAIARINKSSGNVEVGIPSLTVTYKGLPVTLGLFYTVNVNDGTYGKVYVNITKLGEEKETDPDRVIDVKVCCDIEEVITSVKALISSFKNTEVATQSEVYAAAVDAAIKIDLGELITKFEANHDKIELGVGLDALLDALKVDLGFDLGNADLKLILENQTAELFASLEKLGLSLVVSAGEGEITLPDESKYADITTYTDGVKELLDNGTYSLTINFDGSKLSAFDSAEEGTLKELDPYLKDITASANAIVKADLTSKVIRVHLPAVTAEYKGLSLGLEAFYTIDMESGNYGEVYLYVKEFCGKAVSAKVYCSISEVIPSVEALINLFKAPAPEAAMFAEAGGTDKIASIIDAIVNIDYYSLINYLTADNTGINASVSVDEILEIVNKPISGVQFGSVELSVAETDGKLNASCNLPALGATIGLQGSNNIIPTPVKGEYLDVKTYVDGVADLLNSESLKLSLSVDGSKITALDGIDNSTVTALKPYIKGIKAEAVANVAFYDHFDSLKVNLPITVSYKDYTISLEVYYEIEFGAGYGDAYVTLTEINGTPFSARLHADIDEIIPTVKELVSLFSDKATPNADNGTKAAVDILGAILSIDFKELINELTAGGTGINLNIDADALLDAFEVDLKGVTLGNVALNVANGENGLALSGKIPAFGIETLTLAGSDEVISQPDKSKYLDAVALLDLVKAGAEQGKAIADGKKVHFEIEKLDLTADGVKMSVKGSGEVDWNSTPRVALDLILTITEGEKGEELPIKLIYDETAEHLVRVTVNGYLLVIDKADIDGLKDGFNSIIEVVNSLIGENKDDLATPEAASYSADTESKLENLLGKVLGLLADMKVELNSASAEGTAAVAELVLSYAESGKVALSADNNLALKLQINNGDTNVLDASLAVKAPAEDMFTTLNAQLDEVAEEKVYKTTTDKQFTKVLYDYLFTVFNGLSVRELLGTDTYAVTFTLDGTASGIEALKDVTVDAGIYYTEVLVGEEYKKLVEIEVNNLVIGKTSIVLGATYFDGYFYITLNQVGETKLYTSYSSEEANTPLAVKASREDLYSAVDTLVGIALGDKLSAIITMLKGGDELTPPEVAALVETSSDASDSEKESALDSVLNAIFSLAIEFDKFEGKNVLKVNIDGMLSSLGVNVQTGDIVVTVDPVSHTIDATVGDEKWAKFNASPIADGAHSTVPAAENYIDIGFVSLLLNDLESTVNSLGENDGKLDLRVSLTGDIDINLNLVNIIKADIKIQNITATAGLDGDGEFYFTFKGDLKETKVIGMQVTKAMPISLTYAGGYLTLGRTNDSGENIYRVMTVEYLIDNLMDKEKSPIRWLLGTSDRPWGLIADNVKVNISSGLSDKKYYYLYDHAEETAPEVKDNTFVLDALLKGLGYKQNGVYNNLYGSEVSGLNGVSDNYYGAIVDLTTLIGNTFTPVNVNITRKADGGLNGVLAHLGIATSGKEILGIDLNLNGGIITAEDEGHKHAENFYKTVDALQNIDYDKYSSTPDKLFGCYDSEKQGEAAYDYSEYNKEYTLNVYEFEHMDKASLETLEVDSKGDINTRVNVILPSGSTVYLLEEEMWLNDEHTKKLIYVDDAGNDLGNSFTIRSDMEVYAMIVGENTVNFYYSDETPCNIASIEGKEVNENVAYGLLTGDKLPNPLELEKGNTTFAGWYTEKELVTRANSVQQGTVNYYAKYIKTYENADNGVTYKFTYSDDRTTYPEGGYYVATSFAAGNVKDGKDYTSATETLVLANELNGYKVVAIGDSAFAGKSIKNVVVPENIVSVGARAFANNVDMQTVVFLALNVTFHGDASYSSNPTIPFAGCFITGNENSTLLKVYYKNIVTTSENTDGGKNDNPAWSLFYWKSNDQPRFIGNDGGERVFENWTYVTYEVVGSTKEELQLSDYIATTAEYDGVTAETLMHNLNLANMEEGYITHIVVADTSAYSLTGASVSKIVVTVTEIGKFYEFALTSNSSDCVADYTVADEDEFDFEGKTYVREGASVTLVQSAVDPYKFDKWQVNGELSGDTFTVSGKTSVEAIFTSTNAPAEKLYVASEIAFVYDNAQYSAGDEKVQLTNATIGSKLSPLTSEGYTFLGWATTSDGSALTVAENVTITDEEEVTYYALWVLTRDDVEFTFDSSSMTVSAQLKYGNGTIYGWYDGTENFAGAFKAEGSAITLTAETTCVSLRLQYSLTLGVNANTTTWGVREVSGFEEGLDINIGWGLTGYEFKDSLYDSRQDYSTFKPITVLEGYTVKLRKNWTNVLVFTLYDGENAVRSYVVKGFKTNSAFKVEIRDVATAKQNLRDLSTNWIVEAGCGDLHNGCYSENPGLLAHTEPLKDNLSISIYA